MTLKRTLPWLFLLGALAASLVLINGTAPSACDELPLAFDMGMKTDVGGDEVGLYSSCEVTNTTTGESEKVTQFNGLGLVASMALCSAACCLGALLAGVLRPRLAWSLLVVTGLIASVALAIIFS